MPCETGKTRLMVPDKTLTILPPALEGEAGALTELFHIYEAAMKVIAVRLEILDAEFKNLHDHNPIHHTEARVKSLDSILQKLERKGLDPTIENIQHYITDVAGLRIANIILPDPEMKKRYDETADSFSMSGSSTFGLEAVRAAYSPEGAEWLEQVLAYLEGNAGVVERWAGAHGVSFTSPEGTFLCWLDLSSAGLDDGAIQEKILMGQEVICVPGPWFGPGGEGYLRMSFANSYENIVEGCARLRDAVLRLS